MSVMQKGYFVVQSRIDPEYKHPPPTEPTDPPQGLPTALRQRHSPVMLWNRNDMRWDLWKIEILSYEIANLGIDF